MKLNHEEIKNLITNLGFKKQDGEKNIYYKNFVKHNNYLLKIDFEKEKIEYGIKIKLGDSTTCNFENSENFVVLECVNRTLEKGYAPNKLYLEKKWPMGRKEKGKLDILILDKEDQTFLMVECKTWGEEYEKEKKKMLRDGGQLFSYFQQDKGAKYLCLYASRNEKNKIEFINDIIKVDDQWKELNNQKEIYDHWNKNFKDNGVFEEWASAYDIEIKALTKGRLKEINEEDSGRIFNQFAEILRHNVVSDKPNAFNKIFNLFLCKILDEDRKPNAELKFQWLESDTNEELQKRLSDLYKQGMKDYLTKEVTDYNDEQIAEKVYALDPDIRQEIQDMFTRVRLHKNNEFAFKEVFDEKSFRENAIVVREVVELLQPFQIRYGHKQQFLGDFFELLLSTGIKQEAGQFFTPVPIAKFIISSIPIRELIDKKIENGEGNFLPYIIDYAAGSGHFLTEAMDEVQNIIEGIEPTKHRPSVKSKLNSWRETKFDWAYEYIYGIEADYRLVKTSKVSCFLNGDGLANVIHADGLGHFQKTIEYKDKLKETNREDCKDNGQFDILVANPPYSVSAFKNTLKYGDESFELFNRLSDDSSEIECLFIERAKQLLKPSGWAGIILPSSILNNTGIYSDAREIILKYFHIKAIAEFGSNTFMATGTNTIALFLERRNNNEWKKIEQSIKSFFNKPKDAKINDIDNAFSKYVNEVYDNISLSDYVTFINKNPNDLMKDQELFSDYKAWFDNLNEIKQLKERKSFIDKKENEQQSELDKLFYEKVFVREQNKLLFFFLTYPQQIVIVKVGEKQAEKDFIGYEFSNRRGHEGIKMYRDENGKLITKLYDEENNLNIKKANYYVNASFKNIISSKIDDSIDQNITIQSLKDLINFKANNFEPEINLSVKKKIELKSKYPLKKLGEICDVRDGTHESPKFHQTGYPLITSKNITTGKLDFTNVKLISEKDFTEINKRSIVEKGDILFAMIGTVGSPVIVDSDKKFAIKNVALFKFKNNSVLLNNYLKEIFNYHTLRDQIEYAKKGGNRTFVSLSILRNLQVPVPDIKVQKEIIKELNIIDLKANKIKNKIIDFKELIKNNLDFEGKIESFKFSQLATLEYGKPLSKDLRKNGKYPVMGSNGIDGYHNEYLVKAPCIIVGRKGSAGKINYLEKNCFPIDTTFWVKYDKSKINIKYLYYLLHGLDLEGIAKGIGAPGLNRNNVHNIKVLIHPLVVQLKLIQKIEKLENEIVKLENELTKVDLDKENILNIYLQ
jgi:type I restriction enzyme M protein